MAVKEKQKDLDRHYKSRDSFNHKNTINKSTERLDIAAEYKSLVSQQEQTYER